MMLPKFNAVIFDMDGLILDTESSYFVAWQKAAEIMGYTLSHEFCVALSGSSFAMLEKELTVFFGKAFSFQQFCELSTELWRNHVEENGIAVKFGVKELLFTLKKENITYCLATNSPEKSARECLQYANIDNLFELVICRDHVETPKPAADLFLRAAEVLGQPIDKCLVVEDSYIGLLAAQNAGAFSILVPSLAVTEDMQRIANVVMDDLSFLSNAIKNLNN